MIRRLLGNEEVGAAVVLALSGAVVVLVSRGAGSPLTGRLLAGVLSNPIPRGAGPTRPSVRTTHEQAAA
jgi:hypothetical protein